MARRVSYGMLFGYVKVDWFEIIWFVPARAGSAFEKPKVRGLTGARHSGPPGGNQSTSLGIEYISVLNVFAQIVLTATNTMNDGYISGYIKVLVDPGSMST